MKIPNYDCQDPITNFKRLRPFMPDRTFRMLICGPSGSGKTNVLLDMIFRLLFYDKIFLYAKNLDQTKYQHLLKTFRPISKEAGYDVVEASSNEIVPVSEFLNFPATKKFRQSAGKIMPAKKIIKRQLVIRFLSCMWISQEKSLRRILMKRFKMSYSNGLLSETNTRFAGGKDGKDGLPGVGFS